MSHLIEMQARNLSSNFSATPNMLYLTVLWRVSKHLDSLRMYFNILMIPYVSCVVTVSVLSQDISVSVKNDNKNHHYIFF